MNKIFSVINEEDGMESYVVANSKSGFNVTLKDLDSGNIVPQVRIYRVESDAIAYAKTLV